MITPDYKRNMKGQKKIPEFQQSAKEKKAGCSDRTKFNKTNKTRTNNTKFNKNNSNNSQFTDSPNLSQLTKEELKLIKKVNPFFKKIDRHYGSFKSRLLGNPSKVFNSLNFTEITPLGKQGAGCRRKKYECRDFSVIFYANGTIDLRPSRLSGHNPDALQQDFFSKGRKFVSFMNGLGIAVAEVKLNRPAKYGVEDKLAREIGKEYRGKFRGMDKSPRHGHIDNFGAEPCKKDLSMSDNQHDELARARVENPEVLSNLNDKMEFIIDTNVMFAKNLQLHKKVLEEISLGINKMTRAVRPRMQRFRTSFKRSATVKGVS